MGFRYRKSINLGGGVRLNLSKKGIGVSAGTKGLRVSVGADGRKRVTASIPGTGISYVSEIGRSKKNARTRVPSVQTSFSQTTVPVTLFDIYIQGIPDDRPVLPKRKLFGDNSEHKRLKPLIARLNNAAEALRTLKLDIATELLDELSHEFSDSQYIKFMHAIALAMNGQMEQAHEIFLSLPTYPNDDLQLLRARCAIAAKDPSMAIILFDSLSMEARNADGILILRAACLIDLQEFNAALEVLKGFNPRKTVNQNENSTKYYYLRGLCYEGLNKPKQAIASYEKALAYPAIDELNIRERLQSLRSTEKGRKLGQKLGE
jgi:tetratricopeptide (TPR) repeat protein